MKKTNLLLTFIMLVGAITSSWAAERTAPTLPKFETFEAGKEYYLYNVGYDGFWSNSGSNYIPYVSRPEQNYNISKLYVSAATDSTYFIKDVEYDTYYYGITSDSYSLRDSKYAGASAYYQIADTLGGYTIQILPKWTGDSTLYLGTVVDDDNICWNATEGNIVWQFMDVAKAERYFALRKLYAALESTNGTGYNVDKYDAIYADDASTNEELIAAATTLNDAMSLTSSYIAPYWTDYPILLETNGCEWNVSYGSNQSGEKRYSINLKSYANITLTGTVTVDKDATIIYEPYSNSGSSLFVYINGKQVRTIKNEKLMKKYGYYYTERIQPGTHTIQWVFSNTNGDHNNVDLYNIGVEYTPTIEVSLLEPGSLGTEVLYNVNHVKDVRRLKVKGEMNSDDWAKITMMTSLFSLDLSEAKIMSIPNSQFQNGNSDWEFLHEIKLPEGLTDIGDKAFYYSNIDNITFPSTLKTIGQEAFCNSLIKEAILPDNMTSIDERAFAYCYNLTKVHYPTSISYIPDACFIECINLEPFILHEGLNEIKYQAFLDCSQFNTRLPKLLKSIGENALSCTSLDSLIIHPATTNFTKWCFNGNKSLVYAEFPTTYSLAKGVPFLEGSNLKEVVFKSPTVIAGESKKNFLNNCPADLTIKVPSFLVNSYKLDEYWYNYNIEGFSTADVKDWVISQPLVFNARERFEGYPNLTISGSGSLKINGEDEMTIDSLTLYDGTKFLSNCDNISIGGELTHRYYTTANYWYFVSMPFDFIVGEIKASNNAKYAIRYYDGARRATNGTGGNWKNFAATDTIKAGTGFILRTSVDSYVTFTSLENDSKQYVVSNEEFVKALDANVSETASNRGWNLVGNPWQTFYNIHILNFTAPITTWHVTNKTYTAYSIIDDDYVISPNQAFFVQCPDEVSSMSFPIGGRQLTSEITTQQGTTTQAKNLSVIDRQLVDVALTADSMTDKTRIVFNEAATMSYEPVCDASKFFTMENGVSQVYTIDNEGNNYSINERPETDGMVKVGVIIAASGKHTFSLQRNKAESVILIDLVTGVSHDLMSGDYEFTSEAGTYNDRFILNIKKTPGTTGIDNAATNNVGIKAVDGGIEITGALGTVNVYSIDGCIAATVEVDGTSSTISLDNGVYIVKVAGKTAKVVVK